MADKLGMKVDVAGAEKLQKKLNYEALCGDAVKKLLSRAAITVQKQAMIYSPVEYGLLRASWNVSSGHGWAKIGNTVRYAKPLEESGYSPAYPAGPTERIPFFEPAIRDTEKKVDDYVKEAIKVIENKWRH